MSLNKVQLIGNLGSDVEVKTFDDGGKIGQFSLATTETYKDKKGEKVKNTTWHNIVSKFPKQVDVLAKYLSKGDKIYLEGKINNRSYENKDGVKKYISEIIMKDFIFLTTKNSEAKTESAPAAKTNEPEDDLPF